MPFILARDAIHPCCRDVSRRVLRGRREFNRRRRHIAHISGANLAGSRSESGQRHEHSCTLAGIVRWLVWLSPRDERHLDDTHAARGNECRGWRIGRLAFDPYAFAYVRAARAILDFVRHDPVHAASADDALAAYAHADNGIAGELVDDRDHRSIFLFDVWRLFWSRQRDLDAGGDGFARLARYSPRERNQELSGHLHQQRGGVGLFDYALGCVAPSAIHGCRRIARRLLRRPHRATRWSNIHQARNRGYRIGDYDCDAVADEVNLVIMNEGFLTMAKTTQVNAEKRVPARPRRVIRPSKASSQEDKVDARDAQLALKEAGPKGSISWEKLKKELGI